MALRPPSHNTKRHTIDILFAVALQLHPVEPLDTYHVHIQLLKAQRTYSRNVQIRIECSMQAWYCNNGRKRAQKEQPNNYCGTIIRSLIGPLSHIGHARTHTHTYMKSILIWQWSYIQAIHSQSNRMHENNRRAYWIDKEKGNDNFAPNMQALLYSVSAIVESNKITHNAPVSGAKRQKATVKRRDKTNHRQHKTGKLLVILASSLERL